MAQHTLTVCKTFNFLQLMELLDYRIFIAIRIWHDRYGYSYIGKYLQKVVYQMHLYKLHRKNCHFSFYSLASKREDFKYFELVYVNGKKVTHEL